MGIYFRYSASIIFVFCHCVFFASAQHFNPVSFEKQVKEVVARVSPACVMISRYDSTGHKRFGAFSGVVIQADGLILTAAHATITGESYLIEFPGGQKCRGTALARIPVVDAALIKIDTVNRILPYCDMGWSYDLKVNQPCLSIAYPGSLSELKSPVLRLGYIARTVTPEGKMQTTCLMEPGDSGGPVFDLYGRVIALHSKIEVSLKVNLENPIDNYRKYWSLLKEQKDYPKDFYPDPIPVGIDPMEKQIKDISAPVQLSGLLKSFKDKHQSTSVGIKSTMGSVEMSAWGSVISLQNDKKVKYVISKSSIVGDHPILTTSDLKTLEAIVLKRDSINDLVLLKAEGLPEAIVLNSSKSKAFEKTEEGAFLISPSYMDSVRLGVLGNDSVRVTVRSTPMLGILSNAKDSSIVKIIGFTASISQKYGLQVDDVIDSLNGIPVTSAKQLNLGVLTKKPGDDVIYSITRAAEKLRIHGFIQRMPKMMNKHIADTFDGGMSLRSEGFRWVFVQDGMVRPEECGGPVFDLNGDFRGINIARLSRTSTLGLPSSVVIEFVLSCLERPI